VPGSADGAVNRKSNHGPTGDLMRDGV